MEPSSPPEAEEQQPANGEADLEARLRQAREERVRKSLARLDRDRVSFTNASGAATLLKVIGAVVAILAVWAVLVRFSS
jgi:hypothetical protein